MPADDPSPKAQATDTPTPGRWAAAYRAIARNTPQMDVQILGRVLLHAAPVGAAAGLMGAVFVGATELLEHVVLGSLAGYVPLCAAGETCAQSPGTPVRFWVLLFCPAIGALLAGLIAHRYAPDTLGGGADATIEAFHSRGGAMRRRVAPTKLIAPVLTLGFGGSGGREGPTMQMGGAIGSVIGRLLRATSSTETPMPSSRGRGA